MTNIITTEIPICVNNGCTSPCMIRKDGKWSIVCSRKCLGQYNSIKSRQKSKQTCIERYGVENPMSNSQIHDKFKKAMIEKYGVEYGGQSHLLNEKKKITNLERYGVENPMSNSQIHNKFKKTMIDKYGVENALESEECMNTLINTNMKKYNVPYIFNFDRKLIALNNSTQHINPVNLLILNDINELTELNKNMSIPEIAESLGVTPAYVYGKFNDHNIKFKSHNKSMLEVEILKFINQHIDNVTIIEKDRKILNGKEIDILIPSHKLAIECNGTYWHSELNGKNKNYHLNKTNLAKSKGWDLIHIWENDWISKRDIIKSIILSKIKITQRIYGRKTSICTLSLNEEREIFNNNHIQGYIKSKICYGLKIDGKIVAAMSFGISRYNKNYEWELLRYANILNTTVIGGANKLFKYFITTQTPKSIISYCHRHLFTGKMYEHLKMVKMADSQPSYKYFKITDKNTLYSRLQFQKHKLKSKLESFEPNATEWENMQTNGYDRIWDCGNSVWTFNLL